MPWYAAMAARAKDFAMPAWESLPDLGLYMDQVITYLERVLRPVFGQEKRIITPSMINNYVKAGLVHRPVGKKYDREQIAQLLMLCALKQVQSLEELRRLIAPAAGATVAEVYALFCQQVEGAKASIEQVFDHLTPLRCAVMGATFSLLCEEMLRTEGDGAAGEKV